MDENDLSEIVKYIPEPKEQYEERKRIYKERYMPKILALSKMIDTYQPSGLN